MKNILITSWWARQTHPSHARCCSRPLLSADTCHHRSLDPVSACCLRLCTAIAISSTATTAPTQPHWHQSSVPPLVLTANIAWTVPSSSTTPSTRPADPPLWLTNPRAYATPSPDLDGRDVGWRPGGGMNTEGGMVAGADGRGRHRKEGGREKDKWETLTLTAVHIWKLWNEPFELIWVETLLEAGLISCQQFRDVDR